MATIKDVARESGVCIATVSNYINHSRPVSKETAKIIQKAIDKLHYSPNVLARSVRNKSNKDIGVILPDLDDSYYVQVYQGISAYFRDKDYSVNVEFSENVPEFEHRIAENFLNKRICGLILVSCRPDSWKFYYDNFTSQGIPVVLLDRNIYGLAADFISFDNYNMVKEMTERLLEKGCREIYLVSGPEEYTCEADCIRGFKDACSAYGIPATQNMCLQTDMSKEAAFREILRHLRNREIDAVLSTRESLATGVIEGLTILNGGENKVPVVTLGEEHWNYYTASFASEVVVRVPIQLGRMAAQRIEKQLLEPLVSETEKIVLANEKGNAIREVWAKGEKKVYDTKRKLRVLLLETLQSETLIGMLRNFESITGIEVEAKMIYYLDMYDTIVKNHNQEIELYDIIMYSMSWLPDFASNCMLEDITEEAVQLKEVFFKHSLEDFGEYRERYYGLPFLYGPQFLYYRKDLFQDPVIRAEYEKMSSITLRPPMTLKEFNTIADFFANRTDTVLYGISLAGQNNASIAQELYWRLLAFGGKIFDENGNVCLDSDQTLKAYIHLVRSARNASPDYRNITDAMKSESFLKGETAMVISYPTNLIRVTDLRKYSHVGEIGWSVVPGRVPLLGGWGLGISSKSTLKEEAMEFLRWICDEKVASYMTLLGGQPAVTSAYQNDSLLHLYPWLELYHSINRYAKPILPPTLENGKVVPLREIEEIIAKWLYILLDTHIEVQEAIRNTHLELEKLIEQYKE